MKWPFYKAVFIESLMLPNSMAFVIVLLGFAVASTALPARGELCGALAAGGMEIRLLYSQTRHTQLSG